MQMPFLQLDARALNVDNELKSRFGGSMGQEGGGNNRRYEATATDERQPK